MNLTHLIALTEVLDQADIRLASREDAARFLTPFGDILGNTYSFKHENEITLRAKERILLAIETELLVLRTQCKIELAELRDPALLPKDLAKNIGAGFPSVFDQVINNLQSIPGSGYERIKS